MSFKLDQRAFGYKGLVRAIRMFICGHPWFDNATINQGAGGSVGSGEPFSTTGPTATTGRLRLTCTTGGGAGVAIFSVAYTETLSPQPGGSPPAGSSPFPTFVNDVVADTDFEENDVWIYILTTVDWVVGNFIDFDYIPSPNTTPWAERRFISDADGSPVFGTPVEWIAAGPGDLSPLANITIGMQTLENPGDNEFNIRCNYFTSYADTSPETDYDSQPGRGSIDQYLTSNVAAMDWYITCNTRRFMVAARHNTGNWLAGYFGFIEPLAGITSYPYPIAVGASTQFGDSMNLNTTDVKHSAFWDPGRGSGINDDFGSLVIRTPVGGDQSFANKTDLLAEPGNFSQSQIDNVIWPWGGNSEGTGSEGIIREDMSRVGRAPQFGSPLTKEFVIFRAQLFSVDFAAAPQTLGYLDGVFFIPGETASTIAGGDTFVLESPEVTYLVVQDTFRGTPISFAAFRMDPD